jgi:hypothetical protein
MKTKNPSFIFPIVYADAAVICKVTMKENRYDIHFDGRWMASIGHTEEWTWIQEDGVILPDAIIEEIGLKIESEYK